MHIPYYFEFKTHTTLKKGFSGEKKLWKQIHFTVHKIYYSFSEATSSLRKMKLSRLSKSEK